MAHRALKPRLRDVVIYWSPATGASMLVPYGKDGVDIEADALAESLGMTHSWGGCNSSVGYAPAAGPKGTYALLLSFFVRVTAAHGADPDQLHKTLLGVREYAAAWAVAVGNSGLCEPPEIDELVRDWSRVEPEEAQP